MKNFILTLISKILYLIAQPKKEKSRVYLDFNNNDKNDLLEIADKLAMIVDANKEAKEEAAE